MTMMHIPGITAGRILAQPSFNPADYVSNLFGYWNADNVVTSGASVTDMTDLSGNANPFTGGVSPAYNATGWGGTLPTVDFDGVDDYLLANGVAANYDGVAANGAWVMAYYASVINGDYNLSIGNSGSSNVLAPMHTTVTDVAMRVSAGGNNITEGTAWSDNTLSIVSVELIGATSMQLWLKTASGETTSGVIPVTSYTQTLNLFCIGALARSSIGLHSDMSARAIVAADAFTDRAGLVSAMESALAPL